MALGRDERARMVKDFLYKDEISLVLIGRHQAFSSIDRPAFPGCRATTTWYTPQTSLARRVSYVHKLREPVWIDFEQCRCGSHLFRAFQEKGREMVRTWRRKATQAIPKAFFSGVCIISLSKSQDCLFEDQARGRSMLQKTHHHK